MSALNRLRFLQAVTALVAVAATAAYARDESATVTLAPATDIIGIDIVSNDGREAGKIEYLLIDSSSGRVNLALISAAGELELTDDELVAVPFEKLDIRSVGDDKVRAGVSLSQLRGARRVDEDSVHTFAEPLVITQVYDYYGLPEDETAAGRQSGSAANRQAQSKQAQSKQGQPRPTESGQGVPAVLVARDIVSVVVPGLTPAEKLLGASVGTPADEDFGDIDEVVLDLDNNRVAYVLIGHGGFLGLGENWYPLPIQKLRWNSEEQRYGTGVDADSIDSFRGLPKSNLPSRVQKSELDGFYRSFGIDPNQSMAKSQSGTASPKQAGRAANPAEKQDRQQNKSQSNDEQKSD